MSAILIYALLWLSFGFFHSLLTISSIKSRLEPMFGSAYRLSYNVLALVHIALVFYLGKELLPVSRFVALSAGPMVALSVSFMLAGALLILLSLRQYDLGQFSGLTQWRASRIGNDATALEPLNVSGLNARVRHPLYSGLFLFLWGNAVSPFGLWTAIFASVYVIIGARHEENQLINIYGEAYLAYKSRVPAFFPVPRRG